MSKLLTPNEILSSCNDLAVKAKEAKILISESVDRINETVKCLIPSALISVCCENVASFKVEIGGGNDADEFHICKQGENLEIVEGFSLYSREANLVKFCMDMLNRA